MGCLRHLADLLSLVDGQRQWLLAIDIAAGFHSGDGDLGMPMIGRPNGDHVDVIPLDQGALEVQDAEDDLLADSVTNGTQIPLYNGGRMYRDWTYVDDITDGVVAALNKPLGYQIINLGRGEAILLKDFVEMIETLSGRKANVIHKPKLAADFVRNEADITKARSLLLISIFS